MRKITGLVASSGLVVGKVFKLPDREERNIPLYSIKEADIPFEKKRLQKAILETQREMQNILEEYKKKNEISDELGILNTHFAMLSDEDFIVQVLKNVEE